MKNCKVKFVFLVLILWSCQQKYHIKNPPNIIVIITDDQRWDAIGYVGNEIIITPEQDQ